MIKISPRFHADIAQLSSGAYYEKLHHFWEKVLDILDKYEIRISNRMMPTVHNSYIKEELQRFSIPLYDVNDDTLNGTLCYTIYHMPIGGAYEIICYVS